MPDAITLGPLAVPPTLAVALFALLAGWFSLKIIERRQPESAAEVRDFRDRVSSALLVGFLVWKLYPLLPWWSAIVDDPVRLLRLPGGRVGTVLGTIAASAVLLPRLIRRPSMLRPAIVAVFTSALGALITVGALQALVIPSVSPDAGAVFAMTGKTLSHHDDAAVPVVSDSVPTVVTFWATWCGPCRAELPVKKAAFENSADNTYRMVSVNMTHTEGTIDQVETYVMEHEIEYPVFLDTRGELSSRMGVRGTPTTIVFGPDGTVRARWMGPSTLGRLNRAVADARTAEE